MICYVCGANEFGYAEVLWEELIREWQLANYEVDYINRQQGFFCKSCGSNLRSIALAKAILVAYGYKETLLQFVKSTVAAKLRVLEINSAGTLSPILAHMPLHRMVVYPNYDMMNLIIASASFDLVLHSDTLEHIQYPLTALSECRRVLTDEGRCIFTVPIVIDRLTQSRSGLSKSYHGTAGESADDFLVHTEFGADVWKYIIQAGFSACTMHCIEYPGGLAIEARV